MAKDINLGYGTGRRKTAVARVYFRQGSGKITVNSKDVNDFFADPLAVQMLKEPLLVCDSEKKYDILVNVSGGGTSGQAGAVRHGIARGLQSIDEKYTKVLRENGFLTRDSRMVERKKYGQKGARRKFQFSKR